MLKKTMFTLALSCVLVLAACAQDNNNDQVPGQNDPTNEGQQSYQGYNTKGQPGRMGGFGQNRQDMWGGFTRNRQYGLYDERGTRGLRQYHRYGERGLWERYGDPLGPGDRTLGYDATAGFALANQLENRCENIPGVQDAQVVMYKDDILVGVQTAEGTDAKQLESRIKAALNGQVEGKEIHVITDEEQFNRLGDINRQIRDGQPISNFAEDIGDILNSVGRAVTEPFRR